jgi:glycosyltransferase A (GT-A) superfamily protein (DUF2064 family)
MRQALFVMAKDPRAGQVKTRLCPPLTAGMAARLYECFLLDVLDLVAGFGRRSRGGVLAARGTRRILG